MMESTAHWPVTVWAVLDGDIPPELWGPYDGDVAHVMQMVGRMITRHEVRRIEVLDFDSKPLLVLVADDEIAWWWHPEFELACIYELGAATIEKTKASVKVLSSIPE